MTYNKKRLKGVLETINTLYNSLDANDTVKQLNYIQAIENIAYKNYIQNKGEVKNLIDLPF